MFKVLNVFFDDMFFLVKEIMTNKLENVSFPLSEQFTTDSGLSFPWASTLFFQSDKQNTQMPSQLFYPSPAGSFLKISVISVTLLSLPLNKQITKDGVIFLYCSDQNRQTYNQSLIRRWSAERWQDNWCRAFMVEFIMHDSTPKR